MKHSRIISILLLMIFGTLHAQYSIVSEEKTGSGINISVQFNPANYSIEKGVYKNIIDFYDYADPSKPGFPALPSAAFYIAIPPYSTVKIELTNKQIEKFTGVEPKSNPITEKLSDSTYKSSETALLNKAFTADTYPSNEIEILGYTWIRDYYCAIVRLNNYRYNWKSNEITFITSATLKTVYSQSITFPAKLRAQAEYDKDLSNHIINNEQAAQFRSVPNYSAKDPAGSWIDYSNEYIKMSIAQDGIYRISHTELKNLGINLDLINPKTFKLFSRGIEKPIFINGESDNSFDASDYIEFFSEKNYGSLNYRTIVKKGEEYQNYMDRYSDTNFVWLSWGGNNGLRTETVQSFNSSLTDIVSSHLVKLHFEKDVRLWYYDAVDPRVNLPFYQENKVWTWFFLGNSGSSAISFNADNVVTDDSVNTFVRFISNAANIQTNAHKNGVSLNSQTVQETITYDYKSTVNLNSVFSTNNLINGNNILRVYGMPTSAAFHQSLIDWIDIEYPRYNVAQDDSIILRIRKGESGKQKIIEVKNILSGSDELIVYKTKPVLKRFTNYSLMGGLDKTLRFSDNVSEGDEYLIIKTSLAKKPGFVSKKKFANLRNKSKGADYILITHPSLSSSVLSYNEFIKNEYKQRTELIFVNDIYDEFNYGIKSAESIREFLKYSYTNWTAPAPSYLTIVGDANYDFKDVVSPAPAIRKKDLVPSFGMPVSDSWYVTWDSIHVNIPQMFVGRIPAENNSQVINYLNKHRSYKSRSYDEWNKLFLFFSGGDPNKNSELEQIRSSNQYVLDNYVEKVPVGGSGKHFYKTLNPASNFGPVTQQQVNEAISKGGLFVSYIGHSGTQTWDNGITSVIDLKNNFNDRFPLITDFGCSTGRFAEPDVNAFGESFTCGSADGQAIAYLGNSSFGYTSTSLVFPKLFYQKLLIDSTTVIGKAHNFAKLKLMTDYGISDVNRVFNYCNLLFGDPIISLATPSKPNFAFIINSISLSNPNPSDMDESVKINIRINNFGRVPKDSVRIYIGDEFNGKIIFEKDLIIPSPLISADINIEIPVLGKVGKHQVTIEINKDKRIDEFSYDDNKAQIDFNVYSSSTRAVENDKYYNANKDKITLLNPISRQLNTEEKIVFSISDNEEFINASESSKSFDSLYTAINLQSLDMNKRYWWKSRVLGGEWSSVYSFATTTYNNWFFGELFNASDVQRSDVEYNQLNKSWQLGMKDIVLGVTSAGSNEGKYASIIMDGEEQLINTFFWGIATAELDTVTMKLYNIQHFIYPSETSGPALINYINSLPVGKTIVAVVCDDAAQSVLGFGSPTEVRNALKTLGSKFIDNVGYRQSWCIIGRKGAAIGTVPESYKKAFEGPASVSLNKLVRKEKGTAVFPLIANSVGWKIIHLENNRPANAKINITPIGLNDAGQADTLSTIEFLQNPIDISHIEHKKYPNLKLKIELNANALLESPQIKSIGVNYKTPPELGLNYQVVSTSRDSIKQGEPIQLYFSVVNAGNNAADSFNVNVELNLADKTKRQLFDTLITRLGPLSKKHFSIVYNSNTTDGYGDMSFSITADNRNKLRELFKDNNNYRKPFYVKKDETTSLSSAAIKVFFDGNEILDDDYVSSAPTINAELSYQGSYPVHDTTAVQFYLDRKPISHSHFDYINYDSIQRKVIFNYKPKLEDGNHSFSVTGKDISGNLSSASGYEIRFTVQNEMKLLNTYNFPNPFNDYTNFTFQVTQIPDECYIKIFTVAGRLIKEIQLFSSELKTSLNTIYWDGRDSDGDFIANGIYFYKLGIKKAGKIETVIQKLAVVR